MIYGVISEELDKWWDLAVPHLEAALARGLGEYAIEDIKEMCKEKQAQLWLFGDEELKGAFVTKVNNYPQLKVLLVLLMGGTDYRKFEEEIDELLNGFGKDKGCRYIEFFGRKGWGNFLKANYKEQVRMYTKEIV